MKNVKLVVGDDEYDFETIINWINGNISNEKTELYGPANELTADAFKDVCRAFGGKDEEHLRVMWKVAVTNGETEDGFYQWSLAH